MAFNGGQDVTPLCAGTFGGVLRLGLMCGFREAEKEQTVEWVDVNVTAEAQANAEAVASAQVSANASANANAVINMSNSGSVDQSGDGCYRNNTTIEINIFSIVKNLLNIGNKTEGGCEE